MHVKNREGNNTAGRKGSEYIYKDSLRVNRRENMSDNNSRGIHY